MNIMFCVIPYLRLTATVITDCYDCFGGSGPEGGCMDWVQGSAKTAEKTRWSSHIHIFKVKVT